MASINDNMIYSDSTPDMTANKQLTPLKSEESVSTVGLYKLSEKPVSYDIGSNMGFEKSEDNRLAKCYNNLYKDAQKKLLEYERNCPDRESSDYEKMCSKVDEYECLAKAYQNGDLEKPLTIEESEYYAKNKIKSEKEKNPYWEQYEASRLKFIEVEKSCTPDSETYKRTLKEYKRNEELVKCYPCSEDDAAGAEQQEEKLSRLYIPSYIKNTFYYTFLDESDATIMKSADLVKSQDGKFYVSVGGNLSFSHSIGQEKETINQHNCSAGLTGELGVHYDSKALRLSSSLSREYAPSFQSGKIDSSDVLSAGAEYNIKKFRLSAEYSGSKFNGGIFSQKIQTSATYNPTDTVSVTLSNTTELGRTSPYKSVTLSYYSPDNKYNISGECDITGEKTAEVRITGTIRF